MNTNTPDHVLDVDDDLDIRGLLRDYLQKNGYRVTAVGDGRSRRGDQRCATRGQYGQDELPECHA